MSERQASNFRQGSFTSAHVQVLTILSQNNVCYLAEESVNIWGEFDNKGRPIRHRVDILINDANWGAGIVEIDGEIHTKLRTEKKDERRDKALTRQNLWVEHIHNEDVSNIMQVLEKHRRPRDDYS